MKNALRITFALMVLTVVVVGLAQADSATEPYQCMYACFGLCPDPGPPAPECYCGQWRTDCSHWCADGCS